jgi:signal transduction histidine kinase
MTITTSAVEQTILAIAAHELRNTISPLATAVELLSANDPLSRELALGIARRQLTFMRQLVSDMAEAGTCAPLELARKPIVLQDCLNECLADCAAIFSARDQPVSSSFECEPLWVYANRERMAQVFANLLGNASKYTHCGGNIAITCKKVDATHAEVAIADDGAGILPENLSRIFEPFYRELRSQAIAPGLGVGLGVVSTLVRAHGGCVWAESLGPEMGSRFVIRMPLLGDISALTNARAEAADAQKLAMLRRESSVS